MKFFCLVTAFAFLFTPTDAVEIAKDYDEVLQAEAIRYNGEIFVAVVSKPIYLRSDSRKLCDNIKSRIEEKCGTKAYVVNDFSLYIKMKSLSNLHDGEREKAVQKIVKTFLKRCADERY